MALNLINNSRTVSALAVVDLAEVLISRGITSEPELGDIGEDLIALREAWKKGDSLQEFRLPESYLIALWQMAQKRSEDDAIGVEIGSYINHRAKGILANWLFQCETLAEAFDTFKNNIALVNPSETWTRIERGDNVDLIFQFELSDYPVVAIDRSMASILTWSRALAKENINPVLVTMKRERPKLVDNFSSLFGENIQFDARENAIVFSTAIFERTIKESNAYLKKLVANQAKSIATNLTSKATTCSQVMLLLEDNLADYCQIHAVCSVLHMSRSTLFRKLKHEGTSFTALVKEARLEKIKATPLSALDHESFAELLGFKDVGSYYRFRKMYC